MYSEKSFGSSGSSAVKEKLKSLCCENGWSYGVFWRFDQQNSLFLTFQDAYYEEQMGLLIDDMLLQVHSLGGGVIGQAAFTKKHRWIFSDAHSERQTFGRSVGSSNMFNWDDSEFRGQFSEGIKTIAVIPVEPIGVVHFGSTQKIPEGQGFVDQTKVQFQGLENAGCMLSEYAPSSSQSEICDSNGLFASLLPCESSDLVPAADYDKLMETNSYLINFTPLFSPTFDHQATEPLNTMPSLFDNQLQNSATQADAIFSYDYEFSQTENPLAEASGYFDCSDPRSTGCGSSLTISKQDLPSAMRAQDPDCFSSGEPSSYSCHTDMMQNVQKRSILTSVQSGQCSGNSMNNRNSSQLLQSVDIKHEMQPSEWTLEELLEVNDYTTTVPRPHQMNNVPHWSSPMPSEVNSTLAKRVSSDLSNAAGFNSASSKLKKNNFMDAHPSDSTHSEITNIFSSWRDGLSYTSSTDELVNHFSADAGSKKSLNDNSALVMSGWCSGFIRDNSASISEQYVGSKVDGSGRLFSKLGLDHLLDGIATSSSSVVNTSFEDPLSSASKRRKLESSLQVSNAGSASSLYNVSRTNTLGPIDIPKKLEAASWVGDSCSMNAKNICSPPKRYEKPAKTIKKKAKPGARPRPKDRQQIQDRVAELRELIPNGQKMSIDCLLDRTIKHLLFLQNVTQQAERLKQTEEGNEDNLKEGNPSRNDNGATWACEVGDERMVCPLIVEDLSTPGQMLIQILCEEQGFFLEIVDIIRGFALTIMKGVMEIREDKLWARFNVVSEGNRRVTRHEIFSSLVRLLQLTGPSGGNAGHQHDSIVDGAALFNNYQQSVVPITLPLPGALHCEGL